MSEPLYSVGTWDSDAQAYTPQEGLTVPAFNITLGELRAALRDLRKEGYAANRVRFADGQRDSDWAVLVERTDGLPEHKILEGWKR
jgi:hypothetical protein